MSTRPINQVILACDGCGTEMEKADSTMDARGAAYAAGWRFPQRQRENGRPSERTSDVCPDCLPAWKAAPTSRPRRATR